MSVGGYDDMSSILGFSEYVNGSCATKKLKMIKPHKNPAKLFSDGQLLKILNPSRKKC